MPAADIVLNLRSGRFLVSVVVSLRPAVQRWQLLKHLADNCCRLITVSGITERLLEATEFRKEPAFIGYAWANDEKQATGAPAKYVAFSSDRQSGFTLSSALRGATHRCGRCRWEPRRSVHREIFSRSDDPVVEVDVPLCVTGEQSPKCVRQHVGEQW